MGSFWMFGDSCFIVVGGEEAIWLDGGVVGGCVCVGMICGKAVLFYMWCCFVCVW